jgi:ABC-type transporter Mla subunit MlaD
MVVVMADVDITSLSVEISAESQGAELNINKLANAIANLRSKGNVSAVCDSLDKLAGSIAGLKSASKGIGSIFKNIEKMSNIDVSGIDFTGLSAKLESLKSELQPLQNLDASGLKAVGSAMNAIAKIPSINDKLDADTLNKFKTACDSISTSLTPLASQLDKVGNAFAKLPPQLSKVVTHANRVTAANEKQRKSYLSLSNQMNGFMRNMAKLVSLKAIAEYLGNAVAKFNDFYEATDLFHNAMGNLSGEADTLISKMQGLLGVDPTKAMTYMATIQSLGTSFGLASDKAYILSKNLTQLAYDEGSYWNKDVAETFTAMSSAISGEIEPIRRLGIDLSQARLQQELLALGFNKQVSSLSQADKAVLRYIAIMKQTANVQGNLAQTIQSPANQIKILKAQLDMLAKSVGSLLYPAMKSILPPLIAAVQLIREFVEWVAKLMGVKVVFTDFTKSADSVGGIGDAMDNTTDSTKKAAKALKDYTMGFDELNIIDPTQGSSGSGSGASAGNILGDVDLSGYDMFKEYVGNTVDAIKKKFEEWKDIIAVIGAMLAALGIAKLLTDIGNAISKLGLFQKIALSIATILIEAKLVFDFSKDYASTGNPIDLVGEILSAAFGSFILWKAIGADGITLGMGVAFVASLAGLTYALASGKANANDASVWIQSILTTTFGSIAGITLLTNLGMGGVAAAGISIGLSGLITLVGMAYSGVKGGSIKVGDYIDAILTILSGAAGGIAGVSIALAAGAAAPVAGAALIAGIGIGVVLEQVGVTFAVKDRIKEIEDYLKRYEDAGYTTLAIHYRLKNLGFSDNEINMAEQGIDSTFEIFRYTFNEKLEALNEWWSQKWEGFKENIGKSWDSLKNFAANYWENNSLIHGLIEQTKQNIADLKETLGTIRKAFDQKVKDIEESAANAGRAAAEWVNGVLDKFRKKRDEFFNAGKNLIQGFIDGIKNLKEQAISSVTSIATSAVDKFKSLLGIHSPSTVFAEIGGYIDQGLANGITSAISYVATAMQSVVNAVQEKGNALISAGSAQATNYVAGFLNGLDTQWQQIDSSLQNDFLGSMQTLGTAIEKGDLQSLGKWAASYFYHAMDDEQRAQIKSIAENSLTWLTSNLSGVWNNIAGMASSFIGQLVPSTVAATTAQTGLNIAMDANPILFVVSLIAMLAGALLNLAGTNSDVAGGISSVWGGLKDFMSYIFEGIVRLLGTFVQGFINGVNIMIGAYNLVAQLWGGQIDYIKNPLFEYADKIAAARENSSSVDSLASGNLDYSSVPGTSEYEQASGSGSYSSSSYTRSAELTPSELRDAVKEGFVSALQESGFGDTDNGNFTVRVYLDGKEITSAVEKRQSDRGMSLMGTEAYSY